jgi:hypothetical protein
VKDIKESIEAHNELVREFSTGAKRDSNNTKPFIHTLLGYTRLRLK